MKAFNFWRIGSTNNTACTWICSTFTNRLSKIDDYSIQYTFCSLCGINPIGVDTAHHIPHGDLAERARCPSCRNPFHLTQTSTG